jgi:hypothetical protein
LDREVPAGEFIGRSNTEYLSEQFKGKSCAKLGREVDWLARVEPHAHLADEPLHDVGHRVVGSLGDCGFHADFGS